MKYIDADRLRAEIERRLDELNPKTGMFGDRPLRAVNPKTFPRERELEKVLGLIDSLQQEQLPTEREIAEAHHYAEMIRERDKARTQQEQPEGLHFTPLNRLIQKIPSKNWNETVNNYAKKLRDCLIKEGYLKDAEILQGYISYMNGNNVPMATMDKQEQPEVDLENIFEKEFAKFSNDPDAQDYAFPIDLADYKDFARHFYELGLNARKV